MLLAPPLARLALAFGPPEYLALLLMGLLVLSYISSGPMPKTLTMAALGLLLGTIGIDPMSGYTRFSFGVHELTDGLGVVPLAVGLFGLSEIMMGYGARAAQPMARPRLAELMPSAEEARASVGPMWRGTVIGFLIGIIPGSAHILSSFASYALERRLSRPSGALRQGRGGRRRRPGIGEQRRRLRRVRAHAGARRAARPDPGDHDLGADRARRSRPGRC